MSGLIYRVVSAGYDVVRPHCQEPGVAALVELCDPKDVDGRVFNRTFKTNPKEYPGTERDWTVYLDGSMATRIPITGVVQGWLQDADMAVMRHPHRDCAYEEIEACVARQKITEEEAKRAHDFLRTLGLKRKAGLYACGMIARRWPAPEPLVRLQRNWLKMLLTTSVWRDQVFLPLALAQTPDVRLHVIEANIFENPWFSYRRHGA